MWMWSAEWCKRVALATVRRMGCRRPGEGAGRPIRRLLQSSRPEMMFSWTRMLPTSSRAQYGLFLRKALSSDKPRNQLFH